MKYLKKLYEFVDNEDNQDLSEIKDILSYAIDLGGEIKEIGHRWTIEKSLPFKVDNNGRASYNRQPYVWTKARDKEFTDASKIYKIEVSFISKDDLLYVSDVMKEMHDVNQKLKMVSDETYITWVEDNDTDSGVPSIVFTIFVLSKKEVGKSDIVKDLFDFVSEYYDGRYEVRQMSDVIRVDILSNDLMGNPKTKDLRDILDRKRLRLIKKEHKEISEQIKERLDINVKSFSNDYYNWGISKHTNGRFYPYFFIKIQN